ncbi:MAG: MATE family efflux transporter [Geminicoccaceae bacterium]
MAETPVPTTETPERPPARNVAEHISRTVRLAVPLMLGRAGVLMMVTADTVMIGRVAADEVAFYGMGGVPFLVFLIFGIGVLTGAVPLVAQAVGAGRTAECGRIWKLAMLTGGLLGCLGMVVLAHAEWLLTLVGQETSLAAGAAGVTWVLALGQPFLLMHYASASFMEALGRPLPGMMLMLAANILNVLLNWLFMFEPFGLEPMGATGAALGTTIVRMCLFFALAGYIWFALDRQMYGIGRLGPDAGRLWLKLLRTGFPFGVAQGIETSAFQAVAIFAGWLGTLTMAAYTASMSLIALLYMLTSGLAVATSIRVANALGRMDAEGMRLAANVGFAMTLALTALLAMALWLLQASIAALYLAEPQAARLMMSALWLVGIIAIFDGTQVMLMSVLRGASDTWFPSGLHLIACAIVLAPAAWYGAIGLGFGLQGLLGGMAAGLVVATLLLALRKRTLFAKDIRQL